MYEFGSSGLKVSVPTCCSYGASSSAAVPLMFKVIVYRSYNMVSSSLSSNSLPNPVVGKIGCVEHTEDICAYCAF